MGVGKCGCGSEGWLSLGIWHYVVLIEQDFLDTSSICLWLLLSCLWLPVCLGS